VVDTACHWNGSAWSSNSFTDGLQPNGLYAQSPTAAWISGVDAKGQGAIEYFDGSQWTRQDLGTPATLAAMDGVDGTGAVWAVGNGLILHHQ
jgi:hypothetical protein